MERKFFILVSFILLLSFYNKSLFANEKKKIQLSWKEAKGASGYIIEIANKKKEILINKKFYHNKAEVQLGYGIYYYRIATLNILGEISAWTKWFVIKIIKSKNPIVHWVSSKNIYINSEKEIIELRGDNFYKATRIIIQSKKSIVNIKKSVFKEPGTLLLVLDTIGRKKGNYDLILENPKGKKKSYKNYFSLIERKSFFTAVQPLFITLDIPYIIPVKAKYFENLRFDYGANITIGFGGIKLWGIDPGIKFGYFSMSGISPVDLTLRRYQLDLIFISKFSLTKIFSLNFELGGGISRARLDTKDESGSTSETFNEGNLSLGVKFNYKFLHNWNIHLGLAAQWLLDSGGAIGLFTPSIGLVYKF